MRRLASTFPCRICFHSHRTSLPHIPQRGLHPMRKPRCANRRRPRRRMQRRHLRQRQPRETNACKSTIWHKSIPLLRCRLSFMRRNLPLQAAQPPCACNAALEATQAHYPHDAKTRACPFKGKYLQYPLGGYAFVLGFCKNIRQRHPRCQRRPTRAS